MNYKNKDQSLHDLCVRLVERDAYREKSRLQRKQEQRNAARNALLNNKN